MKKIANINPALKNLCLFITMILVVTITFSSCNNSDSGNSNVANNITNDENTALSEIESIPDNLPERNYGGYDFRIFTRELMPHKTDFWAESETGDIINDAVYNRNKEIEERFKINIKFIFGDGIDWAGTNAQNAIQAGDDAFDILALHGAGAFAMAQKDFVFDLFENMPYINFNAPWWVDDAIKNLSAFGRLYCITGDINHMALSSTGCILFNKDLLQALNIEYPYSDVIDGIWTFDKFNSIVRNAAADLNGDGQMIFGDDRFGLEIRHDWDYPISVFYSGGDRVVTIGEDGAPVLTAYNERTVNIFDKFFDMMNSNAVYIHNHNVVGDYPAVTAFMSGQALFYTTYLQDVINYRGLEYEIGILPLPKYDESTPKYYTNVDAGQNVYAIPITQNNLEMTSIIIEALGAEGYQAVIPAFYDVSLKTKHARDEESSEMIDYIKDGRVYDYGYFNFPITGDLAFIGQRLVNSNNLNFTVLYERNAAAAQQRLDDLNK